MQIFIEDGVATICFKPYSILTSATERGYQVTLQDLRLNNASYMDKAFDPEQRGRLLRVARFKRTGYLVICWIGVACVFISGLMRVPVISCLSLLLSSLSIACVTKYETQLLFLNGIAAKEHETMPEE